MQNLHRAGRIRAAVILLCLLTLLLALAVVPLGKASERQPLYLLRDDGGHLAAYSADGSVRVQEYDVLTRFLPDSDFEELLRGIPVYTDEQLARLVEDFGG